MYFDSLDSSKTIAMNNLLLNCYKLKKQKIIIDYKGLYTQH